MKIEISHFKLILLFGLLSILLMGCQSNETTAVAVQGTAASTETTSPPAATVPAMATATYQPTATLIPTPTPTLSIVEKEEITSGLYETNSNCEFPCWWGIVPGVTSWQTAKFFLGTLSTEISTGTESETDREFVVQVYLPVTEELSEIKELEQSYYVNDGIVEIIQPETPNEMSLTIISDVLRTYGQPSEVWIDTYGYSLGEIDPFRVVLFYPEKGILLRYFDDADFQNDQVVGCFAGYRGAIVLWAPELEFTFAEALNGTRALGTYGEQYYKPLEDASEMDVETFYQTYLDPDAETCIETPAELWMDR